MVVVFSKIRFARSKHFFHVKRNPRSNNTLPSNNITAIYADPFYVYYGTLNNGLARFDLQTERYRIFRNDPTRNSIEDNRITQIVESPNGYVWIGTRNGLFEMDRLRTRIFKQPVNPRSARALPSGDIKALYSKFIPRNERKEDDRYVWNRYGSRFDTI